MSDPWWFRTWYIYSIRQISTGRRYVGMTYSWHNRWKQHRNAAKNDSHWWHPLYRAMGQSGLGDFRFALIEEVYGDASAARAREREISDANRTWYPNGFNAPKRGRTPVFPSFKASLEKLEAQPAQ